MSSNKRRTARQTVNSAAWLEIDGDARLRRCRLVDISANGARLIVENVDDLPICSCPGLAVSNIAATSCGSAATKWALSFLLHRRLRRGTPSGKIRQRRRRSEIFRLNKRSVMAVSAREPGGRRRLSYGSCTSDVSSSAMVRTSEAPTDPPSCLSAVRSRPSARSSASVASAKL
jgi:hypothetical protein